MLEKVGKDVVWEERGMEQGERVEILRQRELMPIAEMICFPLAVALNLHCPVQGSSPAREMWGQMS